MHSYRSPSIVLVTFLFIVFCFVVPSIQSPSPAKTLRESPFAGQRSTPPAPPNLPDRRGNEQYAIHSDVSSSESSDISEYIPSNPSSSDMSDGQESPSPRRSRSSTATHKIEEAPALGDPSPEPPSYPLRRTSRRRRMAPIDTFTSNQDRETPLHGEAKVNDPHPSTSTKRTSRRRRWGRVSEISETDSDSSESWSMSEPESLSDVSNDSSHDLPSSLRKDKYPRRLQKKSSGRVP